MHDHPTGLTMQATDHVLNEIQEMFDRIDEDGDRSISFEEFTSLMLKLDNSKSRSALRIGFDAIDSDHDGHVSFDEFRAWCR